MSPDALVLTVNAGSSSARLAAYGADREPVVAVHVAEPMADEPEACSRLRSLGVTPAAVIHRVVHGGERLVDPVIVDPAVEAEIGRLAELAPLHNPAALRWLRAARAAFGPHVPQVAVFDTAFYRDLPPVTAQYALPAHCADRGIRRYGFHGLAHRSMLEQWREHARPAQGARVISLQLGAGCSITASLDGRPVETSMGFSPLEGLVMATRAGDVDPGVLLYLLRSGQWDVDSLERLLNEGAGLLGVSGLSADMRTLLASDLPSARLAVELWCHRIRRYIGGYMAVLGGVDAVLFGGGIGENAPPLRSRLLETFGFVGLRVNEVRNMREGSGLRPIHAGASAAAVWVVPVDESRLLVQDGRGLLAGSGDPLRTRSEMR